MKTLLIGLFIIVLPELLLCQIQNVSEIFTDVDTAREDYLTIVFAGFFINTQKAYVSINGEEFETILAKSEGNYNYNEALKIMKKYNQKGWVLKNSNLIFNEGSDFLFILMTRKTEVKKPTELVPENLP